MECHTSPALRDNSYAKLSHAVVSPSVNTTTTANSCPEPQQGRSLDRAGQSPPLPICHSVRFNSQAEGEKRSLKSETLCDWHPLWTAWLFPYQHWVLVPGHPGCLPSSLVNSTVAGNVPHAEAEVINFYEHLRLNSRVSASTVVGVIGLTWLDKRK